MIPLATLGPLQPLRVVHADQCDNVVMTLELDHLFILTEPGAAAADLLTNIGFIEGAANDHHGQGTSNRRFFFDDFMLELLYVSDSREAMEGPGRGLRLVERASNYDASPFGLVFRKTDDSISAPFRGWKYFPEYLGTGQYLYVGENSGHIDEPLCVQITNTPPHSEGNSGKGMFDRVTGIRVCYPTRRTSAVLDHIKQCQMLSLVPGKSHLVEMVFNEHRERQSRDLRPSLPLVVTW
jgi:hypothetical protein